MGSGQSSSYISEGDISDDDLDDRYFTTVDPNINMINATELSNRTDAVKKPSALYGRPISLADLNDIEKEMDEFEMVSLLYLLYDNCKLALQAIQQMLASKKDDCLVKWVQHEGIEDKNWPKKLVEALCIIQNYQILKSFGHNKIHLQHLYLPSRGETSYLVKKLRKVLYLTAEKLTSNQANQFIDTIRSKRNILVPNYDTSYLELYFLYWEKNNVNLKHIQNVFKTMNLDLIYEQLSNILPEVSLPEPLNDDYEAQLENIEIKPPDERKETSTRKDNTRLPSFEDYSLRNMINENSMGENSFSLEQYYIDPNNPGVVLIINQEIFYTEPLKEYEHLLHESNGYNKLEDRVGSNMDRDRLEKIFLDMKFKVVVKENLPHYKILDCIREYTNLASEKSSSLIVCILSHGANGVIFGANSCKIEVNEIQKIMLHKKMIGKPKVLILQACQGEQCQQIEEDDGNTTDGTAKVPASADMLSFWATIPGFAAIRNMKLGSWFIQALCDEIENSSPRCHFSDICTKVSNKVTQKQWKKESGINVMTPMLVSTLTKSFFLPRK